MAINVKIFFEIPSNNSGEYEVESAWAISIDEGFKLNNIPFYAKSVALNDIISAQEVDNCLCFKDLIKESGHSTIRLWFSKEKDVQSTREILKLMGCSSEISDIPCLVAVDIPPSISYKDIKAYLDLGESNGNWEYQEACLAQ